MTIWFFAYWLCGICVGFLAGLLGIGGGLLAVPILLYIFAAQGFSLDIMMKMALATSMAAIMFTSVSSFRSHHRLGNVRWDIVWRALPGIGVGTAIGALVIRRIDTTLLTGIFVFFVIYAATDMMLARCPKPSRQLPGSLGQGVFGVVVGFLSSLLSVGGGFITVPFLTCCNLQIRKAIGTSAALGFPIAFFASIGYVVNGLSVAHRPDHSLGYIYLPGLLGIIMMSVLFAPLGAKASQRLSAAPLKRIFALLLYGIAAKMIMSIVTAS
jgi:uncharacterized membrane protein YfcA